MILLILDFFYFLFRWFFGFIICPWCNTLLPLWDSPYESWHCKGCGRAI